MKSVLIFTMLLSIPAFGQETLSTLRGTATALADKGVQVAYGGRVFNTTPALREHIPGHFLGESLEASLDSIERLLSFPQPNPPAVRARRRDIAGPAVLGVIAPGVADGARLVAPRGLAPGRGGAKKALNIRPFRRAEGRGDPLPHDHRCVR